MLKDKIMARSKKSTATNPPPSPKPTGKYWLPQDSAWGGFINIKLTETDKEAFAAWKEMQQGGVWADFDDLLGQGMKVGLSYDPENECYICTFIGRLVSTDTARYCMTSRSGTWEDVIALALWKHAMTGTGFYDDFRPHNGRMDNWG